MSTFGRKADIVACPLGSEEPQRSSLSTRERAAAADHRSLNGLIEKLLADYCKKRTVASRSRPDAAPKAAEMAASTIDHIRDKTAPTEEQQRRKRRLIRGPEEFRDMRRK